MYACHNGHKDVVKMLLEYSEGNIDFNARTNCGRTAFIFACCRGHKDVVKMLLDHSEANIDFNARSNSGRTAFMGACLYERTDTVQILLEYAKAKEIGIPSSSNLSASKAAFNYSPRPKEFEEIEVLIEKYHQTNGTYASKTT